MTNENHRDNTQIKKRKVYYIPPTECFALYTLGEPIQKATRKSIDNIYEKIYFLVLLLLLDIFNLYLKFLDKRKL